MKIIFYSFILLFILITDHKLKLRHKYQLFSSKFKRYYIDFIALLILLGINAALIFLLSLTPLPITILKYLIFYLVVYSLFIVLPISFIDEAIEKIFND